VTLTGRLIGDTTNYPVYVFEAKVVRFSKSRYIIYPPREYQEKLRRFRGRRVKVIAIVESEQ
jgi:hypothetical protein